MTTVVKKGTTVFGFETQISYKYYLYNASKTEQQYKHLFCRENLIMELAYNIDLENCLLHCENIKEIVRKNKVIFKPYLLENNTVYFKSNCEELDIYCNKICEKSLNSVYCIKIEVYKYKNIFKESLKYVKINSIYMSKVGQRLLSFNTPIKGGTKTRVSTTFN